MYTFVFYKWKGKENNSVYRKFWIDWCQVIALKNPASVTIYKIMAIFNFKDQNNQ